MYTTNGVTGDYHGKSVDIHKRFTIHKGSYLPMCNSKKSNFITRTLAYLLNKGDIILQNNKYLVVSDIPCSPSGGAALAMGKHPGSGYFRWKNSLGEYLDKYR
ncbi:DUF4357 domain-containing protein [Paenibacillus terrigena]|uniref:DUF4357 domain-containing protein n=1 Tax=Paenibacillus terrigena TaxID=369333 RepID=UPI000364F5B0|nr:DUF4357 domain-containing protein [Paenibacillus terrigena]